MPCLSNSAATFFNDSTSVSNAESQVALPLSTTAVFADSVISSPNGSAACAGVAAAGGAGVAGAGAAGAAGAGVSGAGVAGVLVGGVAGGDWARAAAEMPAAITA